jgi:hypothetical protein
MHKAKNDPVNTQSLMESYLSDEPIIKNIFKQCYFHPQSDGSSNFYHLFENDNQQNALQDYLGFLDGLKVVEEDLQSLISSKDVFYTNMFVDALHHFRSGQAYDFDNIEREYDELNKMVACAGDFYVFNEDGCKDMPSTRSNCLRIDIHSFHDDTCFDDTSRGSIIFANLQNYIKREKEFIDEMLFDLIDESNPNSIAQHINKTVVKFEYIDEKVKDLETNLKIHFEGLKKGPFEDWLDCTVIKRDLDRSHDKMCDYDVFEMSSHADLCFLILILITFATICIYVMSFCYEDEIVAKNDADFDNSENNSFHTKDEEDDNYFKNNKSDSELFDNSKKNDFKPEEFGEFKEDTFENDYNAKKSNAVNLGPGKGNTIHVEINQKNDEFYDPFNDVSDDNEYNFEK